MDAAGRHRVQASPGDLQGPFITPGHVAPQQGLDQHRLRELGCSAPAAVRLIEGLVSGGGGLPEDRCGRQARRRRGGPLLLGQRLDQLCPRLLELGPPLEPGEADALEHLAERGQAVALRVGEVGAAEERPALGREEDAHRPAALAGDGLHGAHVQRVDVRAFLAIHLDRDEVGVENGGSLLVLERLALHHVAPVAGGIAHGQEDRTVQLDRTAKGLGSPRVPVHGVAGVLEQVRARLAGEPVGVPVARVLGGHGGMVRASRADRTGRAWWWVVRARAAKRRRSATWHR